MTDHVDPWGQRWSQLARGAGLNEGRRLTLALSGGADSVLLLHLLAAARPRPTFRAVHVDHGLRGAESRRDRAFCEDLCTSLDVPLAVLEADLDPTAGTSGLEERAREARYELLAREARSSGHTTLLTGHHADDELETLLLRWMRGSELGGLRGARRSLVIRGRRPGEAPEERPEDLEPVEVVRPLATLRRQEVRALLRGRGLTWVDDTSNRDPRFARSRVRHGLVPALEQAGGREALAAFARAVEGLENHLAKSTAHLAWRRPSFAGASRDASAADLGGSMPRSDLMSLPAALARRALWRLITEGSGRAPGKHLLQLIVTDLRGGRCARHTLPGGWRIVLRSAELLLIPPPPALERRPRIAQATDPAQSIQLHLPFPDLGPRRAAADEIDRTRHLPIPGVASLEDGRRIVAELIESPAGAPIPQARDEVELSADAIGMDLLASGLQVRWPRPGDRFHPLGAPGSKTLRRFLADAGVPREERQRVPVVCAGDEVLWVVGLRPCERLRVSSTTERRLRLTLLCGAVARAG
ncbi:tRNA(Ile)-lysidine synthase [Planctomycetes bacterium Pla86]|uniref:tRNA(Ile)-lysidine synthase n=2 Tax=Engelhardtia mirabilis TaxID=2528011 RepID=A0A518BJS6_9BACT|nr:tRNA(Ile)-lysidine synthase [Planctomycetes bacterium Pla133]QDV01553.1 tRNA(Ile)-lysidine synthase [Planctomycetes bacterium Pla86]